MEKQVFEEAFGCAMQGWQCPICKRVYSPFTHMCYHCGGVDSHTTTTTNGNSDGLGDFNKLKIKY